MTIIDLKPEQQKLVEQVAIILRDAFVHIPETWDTLDEARAEVMESFQPDRISRVALDENGDAVGWIGGIPQYDGNVYELHPLAVKPSHQRRGIGRMLVADLEDRVRTRGALTVVLGTDDEFDGTNLYGQDLYPDIAAWITNIKNLHNHPYEFYQKCGYVIYGIVPDANGIGRPDIMMAKRM
ncbi:MAG: GNAT family N-acetyltransferase [Chloroflexota bacterium]|nr:MAG: GNAT family N-acetyltransferase [Chloroflexota bacterium]